VFSRLLFLTNAISEIVRPDKENKDFSSNQTLDRKMEEKSWVLPKQTFFLACLAAFNALIY
jgi:hypothetical protein